MFYQRINCEYKIDESGSEKKREKRKKRRIVQKEGKENMIKQLISKESHAFLFPFLIAFEFKPNTSPPFRSSHLLHDPPTLYGLGLSAIKVGVTSE